MAGTPTQPNYRRFAPLQSEPAKGSLDPHRNDGSEAVDDADKEPKATLTISQYQDPRDQLDQERHEILAKVRQERNRIADDLPEPENGGATTA